MDLIARRGRTWVFVEVKTRRSSMHGVAAEAVDFRKQGRLRRGAQAWLAAHPAERRSGDRARFDVITCILEKESVAGNETTASGGMRWSIEHWESAF